MVGLFGHGVIVALESYGGGIADVEDGVDAGAGFFEAEAIAF